jgi:hypothetical protein
MQPTHILRILFPFATRKNQDPDNGNAGRQEADSRPHDDFQNLVHVFSFVW